MNNYVVIDTETTTLDGEVVELAYREHVDEFTVTTYQSYFKPSVPISFGAMGIHHITNEMVSVCPTYKDSNVSPPKHVDYLVGHNIAFDVRMLCKHDPRWGEYKTICTLKMARKLGLDKLAGDCKNATLYYYFNGHNKVGVGMTTHSAETDCVITDFIFQQMCELAGCKTIEDVYNYVNTTGDDELLICQFKMHKGKSWKEVVKIDRGYIQWLLDNNKVGSVELKNNLVKLLEESV